MVNEDDTLLPQATVWIRKRVPKLIFISIDGLSKCARVRAREKLICNSMCCLSNILPVAISTHLLLLSRMISTIHRSELARACVSSADALLEILFVGREAWRGSRWRREWAARFDRMKFRRYNLLIHLIFISRRMGMRPSGLPPARFFSAFYSLWEIFTFSPIFFWYFEGTGDNLSNQTKMMDKKKRFCSCRLLQRLSRVKISIKNMHHAQLFGFARCLHDPFQLHSELFFLASNEIIFGRTTVKFMHSKITSTHKIQILIYLIWTGIWPERRRNPIEIYCFAVEMIAIAQRHPCAEFGAVAKSLDRRMNMNITKKS